MSNEKTLQERVEEALKSEKVDAYISHQYSKLIDSIPDVDLTKEEVPILAKMANEHVKVKGVLGQTGNFYSMMVPYSSLPELVANEDVLKLDASREAYTPD